MGRFSGKTCRLLSMLAMTASFFLVEIIVGYVTNSIALVADSFHMLSDVVALIVGFASIRISKWPSRKNTYGWVRAEILGALVNAVFLLALCFSILVESLKRLVTVEEIEKPVLLLAVGSAGLVVNLIGLCLFHNQMHGHSHGGGGSHSHGGSSHSHGKHKSSQDSSEAKSLVVSSKSSNECPEVVIEIAENAKAKAVDDDPAQTLPRQKYICRNHESSAQMNMKGVFLHVLGDALGSIVVIISSLVIWLAEGRWRFYVDPAMSIAMVILILSTTIPLLKQSSLILLQTTPKFLDHDKLKMELQGVKGVLGVHEFHVWQLAGNRIVLSAHITCNNMREYMDIAAVVKDLFHKEGIHSTTIQPEFVEVVENGMVECKLPCMDKGVNCEPDTCCGGSTPKSRSKEKLHRRDRKAASSAAVDPATSTSTGDDRLGVESTTSAMLDHEV